MSEAVGSGSIGSGTREQVAFDLFSVIRKAEANKGTQVHTREYNFALYEQCLVMVKGGIAKNIKAE